MRGVKIMLLGVMLMMMATTLVIYNAMHLSMAGRTPSQLQFWTPVVLAAVSFIVAGWGFSTDDT